MTSRSSLLSILALGIALAGCRSEGELVIDQGVGITDRCRNALTFQQPERFQPVHPTVQVEMVSLLTHADGMKETT